MLNIKYKIRLQAVDVQDQKSIFIWLMVNDDTEFVRKYKVEKGNLNDMRFDW